jgi:hypothetical protein
VNSSVGAQYLVWPVPLLILLRPRSHGYMVGAAAWAGLAYWISPKLFLLTLLSFVPIMLATRELMLTVKAARSFPQAEADIRNQLAST